MAKRMMILATDVHRQRAINLVRDADIGMVMELKEPTRNLSSELVGKRFGRFMVISRAGSHFTPKGKSHPRYECICDCKKTLLVLTSSLSSGRTLSCGCLGKENRIKANTKHGRAVGLGRSGAYTSWAQMRSRCNNPKVPGYIYYGGRGITVCDRWRSFDLFLQDMGERPNGMSIERLDVNGNYEPNNCKWATVDEQRANTRRSRYIEAHGIRQTIKQWSDYSGISQNCIISRLRRGWSEERAVLNG